MKEKFLSLTKSVWFFPVILLVVLLLLTAFRISGTSIGVYHQLLGDPTTPDTNLFLNSPRGVRSDEWVVNTQLIIAQEASGYPLVNKNIGNGQDMSILMDVPYKDWSVLFKPQNLAFFVMPLEFAFAFKWWLLAVLLLLAVYFFTLKLLPGKRLWASIIALLVLFSPFIQWWYQSATLLPIAFGLFMAILIMNFLDGTLKNRNQKIISAGLLAYLIIAYGLILYPPFQISCILVILAFLLGWSLEANILKKSERQKIFKLWPYIITIIVLVASTGILFFTTRKDVIKTISSTVYPGTRKVLGGGVNRLQSFSSSLSPNLQYDGKVTEGYLVNQSEASNFIFVAPFLIVPSVIIIAHERKRRGKILWGLALINLALIALLVRMYFRIPQVEPIAQAFLLDRVPGVRLLLGIGLAGVLQLILLIKALEKSSIKKFDLHNVAIFGAVSCLVISLLIGTYTIDRFPIFIASYPKVLLFSLWISLAVFLLLKKRVAIGLALLLAFSFVSVYRIHPLYRGLDVVTESSITKAIEEYKDDGKWIVLNDRLLINFPNMAGKQSLNSVHLYPQLDQWREIDTTGEYDSVYNRFAHVVFVNDETLKEPFLLKHTDTIYVKFNPCESFFQTNAQHILSDKKLDMKCVKLDKTINLAQKDQYIYTITKP